MERERCPSCGAPYNGRKCRICLYTPMETGSSGQARKIPPKTPSAPRKNREKGIGHSLCGLFIILVLIAACLPGLRSWGTKLKAMDAASRTPEPIPGNPTLLFQHDPITVLVPDQDAPAVALWFYNQGKEDAVVICRDIFNGYRMENVFLSVYVPADSAVKATLLELETLADELTFTMEAQKPNGEFLFETAPIHLKERTAAYD